MLPAVSLRSDLKRLPEAQTVDVHSSLFGHHPEIKVTTAVPLAVFSQKGGDSYIISSDGRLLLPLSQTNLVTGDYPLLVNQTGVTGRQGQQFLTPDQAAAFSQLVDEYKADGPLGSLTFSLSNQPQELDVSQAGRDTTLSICWIQRLSSNTVRSGPTKRPWPRSIRNRPNTSMSDYLPRSITSSPPLPWCSQFVLK